MRSGSAPPRWRRWLAASCGTSLTLVALGATSAHAAEGVSCDDPIAPKTLTALHDALAHGFDAIQQHHTVSGPILSRGPKVCRLNGQQYAIAAFRLDRQTRLARYTFVGARGQWRARLGSHAGQPLPCEIRAVFHYDEC